MLLDQIAQANNAAQRVQEFIKGVHEVVVGRREVLQQIMYAILTKEHVLLEGPPGIAKSYLARHVFENIEGASLFKVHCTKKMTEDSLVGPPNVKILRDEGRFFHNTEGTIVEADFAFVDEFLDLTSGAMRALLEVLNERTFSRGHQLLECPLNTCIATTNFNKDGDEEAAAVLDRFLFKAKLGKLESKKDLFSMLSAANEVKTFLSFADIKTIQRRMQSISIPGFMKEVYVDFCMELGRLTDRTVKKGLGVLRASAVLRGAPSVGPDDLPALNYCFCVLGDKSSELSLASCMSTALKNANAAALKYKAEKKVVPIIARVSQAARAAKAYDSIQQAAITAAGLLKLKEEGVIALFPTQKAMLQDTLKAADNLFKPPTAAVEQPEGEQR